MNLSLGVAWLHGLRWHGTQDSESRPRAWWLRRGLGRISALRRHRCRVRHPRCSQAGWRQCQGGDVTPVEWIRAPTCPASLGHQADRPSAACTCPRNAAVFAWECYLMLSFPHIFPDHYNVLCKRKALQIRWSRCPTETRGDQSWCQTHIGWDVHRGDLSIPAADLWNALGRTSRQQKLKSKYKNPASTEASAKALKQHFYTLKVLWLSALFSTPLAPRHAWCMDQRASRLSLSQLKSLFQIGYKD